MSPELKQYLAKELRKDMQPLYDAVGRTPEQGTPQEVDQLAQDISSVLTDVLLSRDGVNQETVKRLLVVIDSHRPVKLNTYDELFAVIRGFGYTTSTQTHEVVETLLGYKDPDEDDDD